MVETFSDVAVASPTARLHGLVENYVGYHMRGFEPGIHRGLPSRQLTFIISLDGPVDMVDLPGFVQAPTALSAFVSGLAAAPAKIRHDGMQHGIEIELTPMGARRVFDMPAGALAWDVVDLSELLGRTAIELTDRLATAATWPARFAILDEVLVRVLHDGQDPAAEVVHAWECLSATDGAMPVEELAKHVGWSRRHLTEKFRSEMGLPPKVMGRVMRFERAKGLLQQPRRPALAEVAAQCGYFDQAHMTREWGEFAGCSPTSWMAQELPSVQDTLAELGAS